MDAQPLLHLPSRSQSLRFHLPLHKIMFPVSEEAMEMQLPLLRAEQYLILICGVMDKPLHPQQIYRQEIIR